MNPDIQNEAARLLRAFVDEPRDIDAFERHIADLWVANDRGLDGTLGDIYDIVTDWDHKYGEAEVVRRLRDLAAGVHRG